MYFTKDISVVLTAVLMTITFAIAADGATFTVTKTADTNDGVCNADCSLREAIGAANASGDNDVIDFSTVVFGMPQTINMSSGEFNITTAGTLTINGTGQSQLTIRGNSTNRIFFVQPTGYLTISGVTVSHGGGIGQEPVGGGAIAAYASRLTLNNCVFRNNSAAVGGGAILGFYGANVSINGSTFIGNRAGNGGAVMSQSGSSVLNVVDSTFISNSAGSGGAVYVPAGSASFNRSTFSKNSATNGGGALYSSGGSIVMNSTFIANSAQFGGAIGSDRTIELQDTVVSGNVGVTEGGGLWTRGNATLIRSRLTNNATNGTGGGVLSVGNITLNSSTVDHNSANSAGGIYSEQATIFQSTVSFNSAVDIAGGIYISRPSSISTSTFSGNRANGDGGGINTFADLVLTSVTIANNRGASAGGLFHVPGTVNLRNCLIADNIGTNDAPADLYGAFVSNGFNFIETTQNATVSGEVSSNIYGTEPHLLPLAMNGGPTQTHALRHTSSAIDAGHMSGSSLDQRGFVRPFDDPTLPNAPTSDGSDMGAFERQSIETKFGAPFDFDGDGRSDLSVFRPSEGNWYQLRSSQGAAVQQWGIISDMIVPADYDGDGKTDVAVFRKGENSTWYILNSSNNTVRADCWGASNPEQAILFDTPVPADYDGDGKADIAVWRFTDALGEPARFLILQSATGSSRVQQWGQWTDVPVPADYDGDQRADLAIARFGVAGGTQWWVNRSSTNTTRVDAFGSIGDKAVAADYTGDGKTDIAVWRPSNGTWYFLRSENGSYFAVPFGVSTDLASPADYDGDGKTDLGIFRPSNGTWYLNRTSSGIAIRPFGTSGDKPIPNSYVR